MNKAKRRTIKQWCKFYGIIMADPDGFDRKDIHLFERYFTRAEFDEGLYKCSIWVKKGGMMDRLVQKYR